MKTFAELLLGLYRSTMELPPGEHAQWLFGFMQSAFSFDSAGRSSLDTSSGDVLVMGSDVYHEDAAMLGEWQAVNRSDPVLARSLSQPGRATRFHAPTVMASLRDAGMRHYLQHNAHHQNGLVILAPTSAEGRWDAFGFYRSRSDEQFSHSELDLIQMLTPHITQALRINLRLAGAIEAPDGPITAMVRSDGRLRYAGPGLAELLRLEWPGWKGHVLPAEMMGALGASRERRFVGMHIEASAHESGGIVMLRLKARSPLAALSERELEAATLYGSGLPTKEIARRMGVAPSTARNFVQRVYQKLGVNDKAALASLLGQHKK